MSPDVSLAASHELCTNYLGNSELYAMESSDEMNFLDACIAGGYGEAGASPPPVDSLEEQMETGASKFPSYHFSSTSIQISTAFILFIFILNLIFHVHFYPFSSFFLSLSLQLISQTFH